MVRAVRNWMFGRQTYAYGWMRWVAVPFWRVGLLLIVIPVAVIGRGAPVRWTGVALVLVALVVDVVNVVIMRLHRHRT